MRPHARALTIVAFGGLIHANPGAQAPAARPPGDHVEYGRIIDETIGKPPRVERALVWSLIWRESRLDARAINKNIKDGVVISRDLGLGQLNTEAGLKECALTEEDAFNPRKNISCTVDLLAKRERELNDKKYPANKMRLVLAAYNAGKSRVETCWDNPGSAGCAKDPRNRGVPDNKRKDGTGPDTLGYVKDIADRIYPIAAEWSTLLDARAVTDSAARLAAAAKLQERDVAAAGAGADDEALRRARREREEADARAQAAAANSQRVEAEMQRLQAAWEMEARQDRETIDKLTRQLAALAARSQQSVNPGEAARLREDIAALRVTVDDFPLKEAAYRDEVARLRENAAVENRKAEALVARVREQEREIVSLRSDVERLEKENAVVKAEAAAAAAVPEDSRRKIARLEGERAALIERIDGFERRLTAADTYALETAAGLRDRTTSLDLGDIAKHAMTVIAPPPLPAGVTLCTAGMTMTNIDHEVLTTGTVLVSDFLDTRMDSRGIGLPKVYSYRYREFRYSTEPTTPMLGTYVGSLATGDAVQFTVEAGPQLRSFQTRLNLRDQRRRVDVMALSNEQRGCDFGNGLVAAFLPYSTGQVFLIVRANTPYEAVGYLLVRAAATDPVVLLQFRASRVGR